MFWRENSNTPAMHVIAGRHSVLRTHSLQSVVRRCLRLSIVALEARAYTTIMRRAIVASAGTTRPQGTDSSRSATAASDARSIVNDDDAGAAAPMEEETLTCVSVVEEGSQIAFASYSEDSNEIMIEHSHAHGHDTENVVERFLAVARPNLILVSNKIAGNMPLLELLTKPTPEMNMNQEEEGSTTSKPATPGKQAQPANPTVPYRLLKTGAFDLRTCQALILQKLRVLSIMRKANETTIGAASMHPNDCYACHDGHYRRFPHSASASISQQHASFRPSTYHSIASLVDFDSPVQIRALGSLLSFLQDTLFRLEEGATVTVNTIRHAQSSLYVKMDSDTFSSLHIFATEHHPLMVKGSGHVKEGFSLFSLLDRTKSKVGRSCLREWMLKPRMDFNDKIRKRHDGVEMCLEANFQDDIGIVLNQMEQVGAVDKILQRMQKCTTSPMDFVTLSKTLVAASNICATLENNLAGPIAASLPAEAVAMESGTNNDVSTDKARRYLAFLQDVLDRCHAPVMRDLQDRILSIVDEEKTMETKTKVEIQQGFDEELDTLKITFEELDETCSFACHEILKKHPELKYLNLLFVSQIGFLVSLDKEHHRQDPETKKIPGLPEDFDFVFENDKDYFFKNDDIHLLDEEIGDLPSNIADRESLIINDLEEDILDYETEIRSTFRALGELDCILAFAAIAVDLNFVRPTLVEASQRCIHITGGRHPLQELIVDGDFIPNDTGVTPTNRVNIITGPNFSGKSCYARQVGLIVYMAHIGSFVPCTSATISVTDQIFTRISAVETCLVPQSSFQLDLTQMGSILRRSTPSSLVLIDEFGKGTSPSSGIALLTSAIQHLASKQSRVICTTHFLEMFTLGLVRDGVDGIKAFQMAIQIPKNENDDLATPLFKLEHGVASSSAGLVCAKNAGLNAKIVDRATEIVTALREGKSVKPVKECMAHSTLSNPEKEMLRYFIFGGVDNWENATDEQLEELMQKIEAI